MRSTIRLRNSYSFGIVVASATILSAGADACPVGGCSGNNASNTEICSSTCLTNGYTIEVVQAVPGGYLPPECGSSPSGQYIIVEGSTKQSNFSMSHYPGGLSPTQQQQKLSAQLVNPGGNGVYCEANGTQLSMPFWTVTFSNTQGVRACAPARESNLDCGDGSATDMANKFNVHHAGLQLPACGDDNCVAPDGGDGMDSGASDCHGGTNPDNDDGCDTVTSSVYIGYGGGWVTPEGEFHKVTDTGGKTVVMRVGGRWMTPAGVFHTVNTQGKLARGKVPVLPGTAIGHKTMAKPMGNGPVVYPAGANVGHADPRMPVDNQRYAHPGVVTPTSTMDSGAAHEGTSNPAGTSAHSKHSEAESGTGGADKAVAGTAATVPKDGKSKPRECSSRDSAGHVVVVDCATGQPDAQGPSKHH